MMRLIDAEELKRSLSVAKIFETRESLEQIIDAQPTVQGAIVGAAEALKENDARIAELEKCNEVLEKNLEAERNHSKYLYDKSQRLEGVIDALEFAVKCNGVSGPEVTLMRA